MKENKEKVLKKQKEYKVSHKIEINEKRNEYRKRVREKERFRVNKRKKERRASEPSYKLRENISAMIRTYLKMNNGFKNNSTWKMLSYTPQQLREHLEKQFQPWMNWKNYGPPSLVKQTWNIDHIIPQSKLPFDSMDHPNFFLCWSLENIRPIKAIENIKKR